MALPVLQQGSQGEDVRFLQQLLISYGISGFIGPIIPFDADFGPLTKLAVESYQTAYTNQAIPGIDPLVVDGVVGKFTWRALGDGVIRKLNC